MRAPSGLSSAFREIGRVDDICPYCKRLMSPRPQRKSKCPRCDGVVLVRARPLDGARVLLREMDLADLEEDWALDYRIKQQTPRAVDPVWSKRIQDAQAAGPHPDPRVEGRARAVFQVILAAAVVQREDLREVEAREEQSTAPDLREAVRNRLWQMKVQGI